MFPPSREREREREKGRADRRLGRRSLERWRSWRIVMMGVKGSRRWGKCRRGRTTRNECHTTILTRTLVDDGICPGLWVSGLVPSKKKKKDKQKKKQEQKRVYIDDWPK